MEYMIEFDTENEELPLVSVITPTVRPAGLDIVQKSLEKQTYKKWEWLVGSPFNPHIDGAKWVTDNFDGGYWSLNRIYNRLFKIAQGKIIVTWQDWIYIPPDGIQKFVDALEEVGDAVVSGVGDQYERLNDWGKPEIKIWSDPRKTLKYGSFYECYPNDAEWNWCAFPKKLINQVGGMDEKLDFLGYGGDQFQVGQRWGDMGVHFWLDQDNESFTVRHGRDHEDWDKEHVLFNGKYDKRKKELIDSGNWPVIKKET